MGKGKSMNDLLRVEEEDGGVITPAENLFGLIEWVIDTAASNYPVEFQFHRDGIAALLFKKNPRDGDDPLFKSTGQKIEDISTVDKDIEEEFPLQHITADSVKEQQRNTKISEISCEVGKPRMSLDREAERFKLEASKRKLHQGYQQEIDPKHSRKVQVIDLNNLPAACKPSSCQEAPRQRSAAANPKRAFGYRDMHKRPAVIRKRC